MLFRILATCVLFLSNNMFQHISYAQTQISKTQKKQDKQYKKQTYKKNKILIKLHEKNKKKKKNDIAICNNDINCIKLYKLQHPEDNNIVINQKITNKQTALNKTIDKINNKNKPNRKKKKNIKKIKQIEFLNDKQIIDLIDEQQKMAITPKQIAVRTKNKGSVAMCLPQQDNTTKQEIKKENKNLEYAKKNLKEHIKQSLIKNDVSQELVDYIDQNLIYLKPTAKKNNEVISRRMIDFIDRHKIEDRIKNGKLYQTMYLDTLQDIEELFFVDKNIILSIWSMETNYGSFIGNNNAFNALYSACLNANSISRLRYFENNIIYLASLIDKGYFKKDVISSFDGGLGGCQFMPDSVYKFAVSFDGGKLDIINKNEDVLASIGNYLHSMGWRYNEGVLTEIEFPTTIDPCIVGMNTVKTVGEWKQLGIKLNENNIGSEYFENDETPASLIVTDPNDTLEETSKKRAFLVYDNFKVILGYNSQLAYALTAGLLFDGLSK